MAAQYDLNIDQGSNFDFWFQYLTENNIGINLSGYGAEMRVKRYASSTNPEILVNLYGLTYGCTAGPATGFTAIGQIILNTNYNNTSIDGGIKISIGPKATGYLTEGKYFYDIKLTAGTGITFTQKLLEGRVTVEGSGT
jgi:hypothetical protein